MDVSLIVPDAEGWVDARALYEDLFKGVQKKARFADWIKRRLRGVAKSDYRVFLKHEKNRAGRSSKGYQVSAFLAEHISMMEDTPSSFAVRNFYIQHRIATMLMAKEIAQLRNENAMLKAPQPKRLTNGKMMEKVVNILETRDMFGNVTLEKKITRKYRSTMGPVEERQAKVQHLTRIAEGVTKSLRKQMLGDDLN
jgi:phage anti-repressor protein